MEEGSSFVVRDRRDHSSNKEARQKKASAEGPTETIGKQEETAPPPQTERAGENIQINFSSFILSLGTSALIHLGEETDPSTGRKTIALSHAKEVIDLISLLKEKTAGNLSEEEDHFIAQLLFTLRMKFVEIEKRRSS